MCLTVNAFLENIDERLRIHDKNSEKKLLIDSLFTSVAYSILGN
jgi:hypothetical protein